jgi:hypothetical protein
LEADWRSVLNAGNIWLNPPYSRGLQANLVRKAFETDCLHALRKTSAA